MFEKNQLAVPHPFGIHAKSGRLLRYISANFFWIFRKINTAPKPSPEVAPSKMEVAPSKMKVAPYKMEVAPS